MKSPITNIVVFDLETTGLVAEKNAVLEIACCPFNHDLVDLKEYESGIMKVYDSRDVNDGALNANGITRAQIASGRDSQEVANEFVKYLSSMKVGSSKPILSGHNIDKFDIPFLVDFLKYHKLDLFKYVNENFTIDTMWWSRLKWNELLNFKLGTCCETAGVELINAHRAITDTRANRQLVKMFVSNLKNDSVKTSVEEYKRPVFQF